MSIDEKSFSAALVDVRHAYRLLADYQKRCLDMLTLIGQQFPETEFYYWKPSTVSPVPIARTDPRDFWGWNFLPLYQSSLLLVPTHGGGGEPSVGDWLVEVRITSDTGWDMPDRRIEPDASKFISVDSADSQLSVMVFKCVSRPASGQNWFHHVWANTSWPEDIADSDEDGLIYMEEGLLVACQLDVSLAQMMSKDAVKAFCDRAKRFIGKKLEISFAAP
jgi:hypothetical protein